LHSLCVVHYIWLDVFVNIFTARSLCIRAHGCIDAVGQGGNPKFRTEFSAYSKNISLVDSLFSVELNNESCPWSQYRHLKLSRYIMNL
jgi:hypothetical protein